MRIKRSSSDTPGTNPSYNVQPVQSRRYSVQRGYSRASNTSQAVVDTMSASAIPQYYHRNAQSQRVLVTDSSYLVVTPRIQSWFLQPPPSISQSSNASSISFPSTFDGLNNSHTSSNNNNNNNNNSNVGFKHTPGPSHIPTTVTRVASSSAHTVASSVFSSTSVLQRTPQTTALLFADMVQDAYARRSPNVDWQNCGLTTQMLLYASENETTPAITDDHHLIKDSVTYTDWWSMLGQICQRLALSSNHITHLPQDFVRLTLLQFLRLDHNQLETIPSVVCHLLDYSPSRIYYIHLLHTISNPFRLQICLLPNLETLDVSRNKITVLPVKLQSLSNSLKTLILSYNLIERIPTFIAHMNKLRVLKANNNPLVSPPQYIMQKRNNETQESWMSKLRAYLRVTSLTEPTELSHTGIFGSTLSLIVDNQQESGMFQPGLHALISLSKRRHHSLLDPSRLSASLNDGYLSADAMLIPRPLSSSFITLTSQQRQSHNPIATTVSSLAEDRLRLGNSIELLTGDLGWRVSNYLLRIDHNAERMRIGVTERRLIECGRNFLVALNQLVRIITTTVSACIETEKQETEILDSTLKHLITLLTSQLIPALEECPWSIMTLYSKPDIRSGIKPFSMEIPPANTPIRARAATAAARVTLNNIPPITRIRTRTSSAATINIMNARGTLPPSTPLLGLGLTLSIPPSNITSVAAYFRALFDTLISAKTVCGAITQLVPRLRQCHVSLRQAMLTQVYATTCIIKQAAEVLIPIAPPLEEHEISVKM